MDIRQTDKQTNRQTDRHFDSMTDPAQRVESVKFIHWAQGFLSLCDPETDPLADTASYTYFFFFALHICIYNTHTLRPVDSTWPEAG